MDKKTVTQRFLDKLQSEKTEKEAGKFLADLIKYSATHVYFAMVTYLTDHDMEEIEKIKDDTKKETEVIDRFKKRTGHTPYEFVERLRDDIAQGYLSINLQN